MKKLIFLSLTFLIISFLGSCKKDPLDDLAEDKARMYGRVIEKGSNKPVKGATVYLSSSKCQFLGGCSGEVIDSITTDASGVYDFTYKFKGQFGGNFNISVRVPESYWKETSIVALAPNTHEILNYDIVIQPLGWVKIHVKNINPFDEYDKIWVSGSWGGIFSDNQYYGKYIDLHVKKQIFANDSVSIGWDIRKNNKDYFKKSKIFCIAHDTTNFEILY